MKSVNVRAIKVGKRHRKDMGDLQALAKSIETEGLLQPLGVTKDLRLVFGERRLVACRDLLKHKRIPVRYVNVTSIVAGEYAENELRKDFTPSERVAIAAALAAAIPERRGNPAIRQNLVQLNGRTDELIAKQAGFGNRQTYRDATKVLRHGTQQLVKAMDEGKIAISTAALVATTPSSRQNRLLELDSRAIRQAARALRHERKQANRCFRGTGDDNSRLSEISGKSWTITNNQRPITCQAVIAQPPFSAAREAWGADELQAFTEEWCSRWVSSGAQFFAIFWSQAQLFEGRQWLDEALQGYRFQQLLVWHSSEDVSNGDARRFCRSWAPIFLYRMVGSSRSISKGSPADLSAHALDCHVAADPNPLQRTSLQLSPPRAPLSVMQWLIHGLTRAGDQIASLFCGSANCGIAALEMGRMFHGVELDDEIRAEALKQLSRVDVCSTST